MKTSAAMATTGFQHILYATDFSSAAARAVNYVRRIAAHYNAEVVAFHVRPPAVNPMTRPATWPADLEYAKTQDEEHRQELLCMFSGLRTKIVIEEGNIATRLQKVIEKNNIDLIILGTRGRTGMPKFFLGSTAEEIFRSASCPVLTIGPECGSAADSHNEFREILFATQLTSQTPPACAISLAQEFRAHLVILHVVPQCEAGDLVSASDVRESAKEVLCKLVPKDAALWCKPEFLVEEGVPAEKILQVAAERKPDLIVLGVKEETGFPGASTHLPIATAHRVVSHATCPVLTVRN